MPFGMTEAKRNMFGGTINMKTSLEGVSLIKKFEGCELKAYKCAAGVLTIGYGSTKNVQEGDEISQDHADHLLEVELEEYEGYVKEYVTAPLNEDQFSALVAWTYNLGPNNLKASTMLKVLNEGKYDEVPHQMQRWNKANGEILEGLVRRRKAESLLFQGLEWHEV